MKQSRDNLKLGGHSREPTWQKKSYFSDTVTTVKETLRKFSWTPAEMEASQQIALIIMENLYLHRETQNTALLVEKKANHSHLFLQLLIKLWPSLTLFIQSTLCINKRTHHTI